ncbi:MAG: triose-phosphate isomerase [Nitrospirota bacterium]
MRTPIIAGNWKMNNTIDEARGLVSGLIPLIGENHADVVLAPPFTALYVVSEMLSGSNIKLAAQDIFWEDRGAYTGEVSPIMLKDIGCSYVIIGHSERRQYFAEDDESVNRKIKAALRHRLIPIVCIGETLKEREGGKTLNVIERELTAGLNGISGDDIVIAYEPIWAIGTGKTATPEQANEVHIFIRKWFRDNYGEDYSRKIRIQYGGSVTPENIDSLMAQPEIDGVLVGGASLKVESFVRIVNFKVM